VRVRNSKAFRTHPGLPLQYRYCLSCRGPTIPVSFVKEREFEVGCSRRNETEGQVDETRTS
jgi:hypothetical protein